MNKTRSFLQQIHCLSEKTVPNVVMNKAKLSLLDYIAVTIAGAHSIKDKLNKYISFSEPEEGIYNAIGINRKMGLKDTVFLNGLNGHVLDLDDGTNAGIIHLGSPIFSLLLPLAFKYQKSIEDVLRAATIGYEVSYTMAISIQPGHKALGYHATGTCGTLGATIAAAYLLDFTREEIDNAFAIACVSATGFLNVLDDGSELKPYNVAKTTTLALMSIQMAKSGFKGQSDPLFSHRGFIKMMTGKDGLELKPILLNNTYAIQKSYTKPYAACRYLHPAIEAAIKVRGKNEIAVDKIKSITVKTYSLAVAGHDHTKILGPSSAKMSIPYSVSIGLLFGKAGIKEFDNGFVNDANVLSLTKRVQVISDKEMSDVFPKIQSAELEVFFINNTSVKAKVDYPKGELENPLTKLEFKERFDDLLLHAGKKRADIDELYTKVISTKGQISEILKLI